MANRSAIVCCSVVALLALLPAYTSCSGQRKTEETLSAEAKDYVHNLQLSEVTMKATESYSKQVVTEIEGKVTNAGDRTVDFAEVACVFYDGAGQVVLREQAAIIKREIKPGEIRGFRLPFDDIPPTWNNQMPVLVIARIRLS